MNTNEHVSLEDLAMLALLLEDPEDAAWREHLLGCEQCREELHRVRADLGTYALVETEPVAPPTGARERFLAAMAQAQPKLPAAEASAAGPRVTLLPTRVRERRSAASHVLSWAGWAVAAAAVLMAIGFHDDRDSLRRALAQQDQETARLEANEMHARAFLSALTSPTAVRFDLRVPKAKPQPSARAAYQAKTGTLLLLASNLAPLPPHKVYELWLIPASGAKPVPAGTFAPDAHGNASLLVPSLRGATTAKAFGITVEHAGGSATPTTPILLAGSPA